MSHKLNPEQKSAVDKIHGPLLVLAGAGSGKTRVVTFRIANLLASEIPASQILGLTFTNKAAGEMQERVKSLTHTDVLICTFHSLGVRILRESIAALDYSPRFIIYDEDDANKILKSLIEALPVAAKKPETKVFKALISQAKNQLLQPDQVSAKEEPHFPAIYANYQARLKECNAVDFDDLLFLTVRLLKEHPEILAKYQERWSHLLIDEYQDTNMAQYTITQLLVAKTQNLCVVGDPDQSIYSWRGANIENILNFEKDYPNALVVRLEQNYRSCTNILNAANTVIEQNYNRHKKSLWSDLGPGEKIKCCRCETEREEAAFIAKTIRYYNTECGIALNEIVIFYRTNAQSRVFEDQLRNHRIAYVIVGGVSFYARREIKDILAFLRMVQSGADYVAFARTINLPKRGLGETTIEKIRDGSSQEGLSILEYAQALVQDRKMSTTVKLSSKQKEALKDYVRIIYELRQLSEECSLQQLVEAIIEKSQYLNFLKEDKETFDDRKGNLDALISKAFEWELYAKDASLEAFLEELSLRSTLDEVDDLKNYVNLMTIHNGKGLEFDLTFLSGLEEGLFPHINSRDNEKAVEEERRLCYVGMTRAKKYLYLTHVKSRFMWGKTQKQRSSRFLREIPSEYIEHMNAFSTNASPSFKNSYSDSFKQPFLEEEQDASYLEAESLEPFAIGEAVFHKEFGIGHIRGVSEISTGSHGLAYKIFFTKENCEKTIIAKYAALKRL